ncbi:PadR family transcriptional regulator [Pseudonocardiaceae bacterium YIM PH 21723]|nr:PadR family transcriptional regulator [Pseudonocardiaceae bacterium YIM PH 21723]
MKHAERLKGTLDLLLLSVLTEGSAHGYALLIRLREHSAGTFDLPEGTVYPALHRLERQGLLASQWSVVDGRRRRSYDVTPAGRQALQMETAAWHDFSGGVLSVLGRRDR